ncbi:beta-lactamase/transpeptidase-like protein [Macrolepiota fuliginosa MF-IS2]|uniref:Beta-lactamase/transpeptidase-like protein n=1 Tax=Macrolepiota fuliginosa MF-IS2 TaxID=1400762 RepID=A0A9P5WZA4_9AGAR|nr:beta-lactamase/transpeptidase-like protein [Macrolepiota fuliginosa MF-IS2]
MSTSGMVGVGVVALSRSRKRYFDAVGTRHVVSGRKEMEGEEMRSDVGSGGRRGCEYLGSENPATSGKTYIPTGWLHEFGSYGLANVQGTPVTSDTMSSIASNSKLFLAYSVRLLINNSTLREEYGKELKWTTKARDVFEEAWKLMDGDMDRGTSIQDILSHRTGMPRHDFSTATGQDGVAQMISTMRYLRPSAEFRQTFQYNNLMYEALSYLPRLLLNQSFESYINQHIFQPLNMSSSTYSIKVAEGREAFAHGFQWHMRDFSRGINGTRRATVPYFFRPGEETMWAGAGGILLSARDLATWVSMLLNDGRHPYTNKTIVPTSVVEHAATGVTVSNGKAPYPELSPKVYGAGQWRYSYRGHELIEHGGTAPGFITQVARFPHDNLGLIILSNDANGLWLTEAVKWRLVDDILFEFQEMSTTNPLRPRYEEIWGSHLSASQTHTPRPDSPTPPSAPLEVLASGTYNHPAYGVLQPCLVPPQHYSLTSHSDHLHSSKETHAYHVHAHCEALLTSPTAQYIFSQTNLSIPTLLIPFKRTFATHLRLQHFTRNIFNISVLWGNAELRRAEGYSYSGDLHMYAGKAEKQHILPSPLFPAGNGGDEGNMLIGLDENFEVERVERVLSAPHFSYLSINIIMTSYDREPYCGGDLLMSEAYAHVFWR